MADSNITVAEVDGIEVEVDLSYISSWPGMLDVAAMQDETLSQSERGIASLSFYSHTCPSSRKVYAQLREMADDDESPTETTSRMMGVLARAVAKVSPKN